MFHDGRQPSCGWKYLALASTILTVFMAIHSLSMMADLYANGKDPQLQGAGFAAPESGQITGVVTPRSVAAAVSPASLQDGCSLAADFDAVAVPAVFPGAVAPFDGRWLQLAITFIQEGESGVIRQKPPVSYAVQDRDIGTSRRGQASSCGSRLPVHRALPLADICAKP